MTLLFILCAIALLSGFLLMTRVPRCKQTSGDGALIGKRVSIVIPARNEEHNLPRLLGSIPSLPGLAEVIVVDDNSTDRTAEIAQHYHARVVHPGTPAENVTGKAWACVCGAEAATSSFLMFLDADTCFKPEGLRNMLRSYATQPHNTAMSVLPFAVTHKPYEELSLFFNLLMAFGAGGFGAFQPPRLFGQSLLLSRELYTAIGGHASVGRFVLENFHMSRNLEAANAQPYCLGGKGTLQMRMFPEGLRQLCDGWTKAFADGAQSTDGRVLFVSILWLSALASIALLLFVAPHQQRWLAELLYLFAVAQLLVFSRQIGTFRILTCLFFPLPLLFFFVVFGRSALRRAMGTQTNWRGRRV